MAHLVHLLVLLSLVASSTAITASPAATTASPAAITASPVASCPSRLFGLQVMAARNSTGHDNVQAKLDQPEWATWQLHVAAEELAAASGGERRRLTTIKLIAEAEAAPDGDGGGEGGARGRRLEARVAQLLQRLDDMDAAWRRRLEAVTTPAPTRRALTDEKRRALSRRLVDAAKLGRFEEMSGLLAHGADVDFKVETDYTALHWAANNCHLEALQLLIDSAAPLDAREGDYSNTPLHHAALNSCTACAEALVAAGADINTRNKNGNTQLRDAAHVGAEGVVRTLLAAGADPSIRNNAGHTARQETSHAAILALLPP